MDAAVEDFAADVSERKLDGPSGQRDFGCGSDFSDWFVRSLGEEGRSRRGDCPDQSETRERAVDVAAGADALDDLLPEVAAFGEVQGAGLGGLLRQLLIADVGAVKGCSFEDAELGDGFGGLSRRRPLA